MTRLIIVSRLADLALMGRTNMGVLLSFVSRRGASQTLHYLLLLLERCSVHHESFIYFVAGLALTIHQSVFLSNMCDVA